MKDNIVCLDIETTGLDKNKDRIIQIAAVKFDRNSSNILRSESWYILPSGYFSISESARSVHNLTEDLIREQGVSLKSIYNILMDMLDDSDILTYNGTTFDLAFLEKEFEREMLDLKLYDHEFIDSYDIEKRNHSNKLIDVYRRYYGEDFDDAHDAFADVNATIKVFIAQQKHISQDIIKESCEESTQISTTSPEGFIKFKNEQLVFAVGKYKEIPVATVCATDPSYIRWLFEPKNGDNIITIPTKSAIKKDWCRYKESHNI